MAAVTIGPMVTLDVDISQPIKMKSTMDLQSLNVMIGANATGKSLILKTHWAMGTIAATCVLMRNMGSTEKTQQIKRAQEIFDGAFTEQNFHGRLSMTYKNGVVTVDLNNGTVEDLDLDLDQVEEPTPVIFMSTSMRLFSQIQQYLQTKKLLNGDMQKLGEMYRLYDMQYVEMLQIKLATPWRPDKIFLDRLKAFGLDTYQFKGFKMTDNGVVALTTKDDNLGMVNLATLSNGEQAMLNMLIARQLT